MGAGPNTTKGNSCFKSNSNGNIPKNGPVGKKKDHRWHKEFFKSGNTEPPAGYDEYAYGSVCKENYLHEWYYGSKGNGHSQGKKNMIRVSAERNQQKIYLPEHRLMLAILHRALVDCRSKVDEPVEDSSVGFYTQRQRRRKLNDRDWAEIWFEQKDVDYVFSFENICTQLDLSTEAVRALVDDMLKNGGLDAPRSPKLPKD